jgi:hypothetical protein
MGYTPSQYDNEMRTLLLTDGDEKLVVRFRHRAGPAINITYVERLQALMSIHKASHGMLFCSPGLSGNAAQYATQHGIKWYMSYMRRGRYHGDQFIRQLLRWQAIHLLCRHMVLDEVIACFLRAHFPVVVFIDCGKLVGPHTFCGQSGR